MRSSWALYTGRHGFYLEHRIVSVCDHLVGHRSTYRVPHSIYHSALAPAAITDTLVSLNSFKVLRGLTGKNTRVRILVYIDLQPSNPTAGLPPQSQQLEEHPTLDNDTNPVALACDTVLSLSKGYTRAHSGQSETQNSSPRTVGLLS